MVSNMCLSLAHLEPLFLEVPGNPVTQREHHLPAALGCGDVRWAQPGVGGGGIRLRRQGGQAQGGLARCCGTRHPTHFDPSFLGLNGTP